MRKIELKKLPITLPNGQVQTDEQGQPVTFNYGDNLRMALCAAPEGGINVSRLLQLQPLVKKLDDAIAANAPALLVEEAENELVQSAIAALRITFFRHEIAQFVRDMQAVPIVTVTLEEVAHEPRE